jgi:hypothetical protein
MFRPSLETLESREVYAADLMSLLDLGAPSNYLIQAGTAPGSANVVHRAVTAPKLDGSSKEAFLLLPYIEQDNLDKLTGLFAGATPGDEAAGVAGGDFNRDSADELFRRIGASNQNGIIAILIG